VFLTSGQGLGPLPGEIAYAAAKAAIAGVTLTISDELIDAGITANTVNPGPVDTGYVTEADREALGGPLMVVAAGQDPHQRDGRPACVNELGLAARRGVQCQAMRQVAAGQQSPAQAVVE